MSIDVKEGDKLKCPNCNSSGKDSSFFITKHPSGDLMFVKKNYPMELGFVTALFGGGENA